MSCGKNGSGCSCALHAGSLAALSDAIWFLCREVHVSSHPSFAICTPPMSSLVVLCFSLPLSAHVNGELSFAIAYPRDLEMAITVPNCLWWAHLYFCVPGVGQTSMVVCLITAKQFVKLKKKKGVGGRIMKYFWLANY